MDGEGEGSGRIRRIETCFHMLKHFNGFAFRVNSIRSVFEFSPSQIELFIDRRVASPAKWDEEILSRRIAFQDCLYYFWGHRNIYDSRGNVQQSENKIYRNIIHLHCWLCELWWCGCAIKLNRIVLKWFCFSNTTRWWRLVCNATPPLQTLPSSVFICRHVFAKTELDGILNNALLHLTLSALMVEPSSQRAPHSQPTRVKMRYSIFRGGHSYWGSSRQEESNWTTSTLLSSWWNSWIYKQVVGNSYRPWSDWTLIQFNEMGDHLA